MDSKLLQLIFNDGWAAYFAHCFVCPYTKDEEEQAWFDGFNAAMESEHVQSTTR